MEKETVIVPNKSWDLSKESEIEHYKNYSPDIISEYFILGTLRYFNLRKEDQIDLYQDYEEPLVNYLRTYIYEKFRFSLRKEQENKGYAIYSQELSKKISKYFDKEKKLKRCIFKSDEEICSFLLGVYYRDGYKINDSIYKIQFISAYHEQVYILLKKISCGKIFYIRRKYVIPGFDVYYFEPSILLKKYLDSIETEKAELFKSYLELNKYNTQKEEIQDREKEKRMIESFFPVL